ncbi:hypothetical protein BD626DRAFT_79862 [Schizophyllum amplum]|uniref:Uncharacterized protein n=1 Tax=Schizophyllum amplum TaxID=97359 RepID=A0A550C9W7_9AGAR|nr:hypothetical protein BD626DRAFT_79862 [Auriculariopsis ampla]
MEEVPRFLRGNGNPRFGSQSSGAGSSTYVGEPLVIPYVAPASTSPPPTLARQLSNQSAGVVPAPGRVTPMSGRDTPTQGIATPGRISPTNRTVAPSAPPPAAPLPPPPASPVRQSPPPVQLTPPATQGLVGKLQSALAGKAKPQLGLLANLGVRPPQEPVQNPFLSPKDAVYSPQDSFRSPDDRARRLFPRRPRDWTSSTCPMCPSTPSTHMRTGTRVPTGRRNSSCPARGPRPAPFPVTVSLMRRQPRPPSTRTTPSHPCSTPSHHPSPPIPSGLRFWTTIVAGFRRTSLALTAPRSTRSATSIRAGRPPPTPLMIATRPPAGLATQELPMV